MSMIEGIGDEVLQFFGFLFISIIGIIAWWSTGIRERPQIRTVLILEHRSPNGITSQVPSTQQNERVNSDSVEVDRIENDNVNSNDIVNDASSEQNQQNVMESECGEVNSSTSVPDSKLFKGKRFAYFHQTEDISNAGSSNLNSQNLQDNHSESSPSTDNIRIRLKYLNDDQKLVEGRLQELLGDFKRRHFSGELSADKLVRLIFNGQVLQCDDQTLQGYGLYDNCVVHCLVHAQRSNINRTNSQPQANAAPPECNLGFLLYTSVSIILCFAWFFRYHYSQFFTMTTTAGLVGLTTIFAILIIGLYMPDQETVPTQ